MTYLSLFHFSLIAVLKVSYPRRLADSLIVFNFLCLVFLIETERFSSLYKCFFYILNHEIIRQST